ncbi:unnamed protein product [Arabidopsis arenosa]|uniref:RNase H type-1 domain-containing protein n=1 Tax=Arabidopsis arenosa TaxID=38785 RepID=A0A8S2ANF7_ARAAE|nr:unnamed protein product [Arabidopsis arenosa]
MADQDLWYSLQNLNLGSERAPLKLSSEAKNRRDAEHQLSLVVKGLHPSQNPAGIKVMMPKIWKLEGRITSRINDDGSVQFFFKREHQLLTVLDNGPWTYKDWLVVVDRWSRRQYPDFLRIIRFWVRILNLPDDSRNERMIDEIGGVLGHVEEVHIQQPSADKPGEVWVRIPFDISGKLLFARYFQLDDSGNPTLIRYIYDKLRRFCSICGSLTHQASGCNSQIPEAEPLQLPAPIQGPHPEGSPAIGNQQVDEPHTPTDVADDTMGETVGSNLQMDVSENQTYNAAQGEYMDFTHPGDITDRVNQTFAVREIGSASVPVQDRGTKRKNMEDADEDEVSTSRRKPNETLSKQAQGEDITYTYRPDILFLVETKNKDSFVEKLGADLQFPHHFLVSPDGLSGGLAIFWQDSVKCDFLGTPTLHFTDLIVSEGPISFCVTYIYGNPVRGLRQQLWRRISTLAQTNLYGNKPRLMLGDLNEIQNNDEKFGGPIRPEWQFAHFRHMLNISGLHDVKTFGGIYTWRGNRQGGEVKEKLDRAVANAEWQDLFPKAYAQLLKWCGSDHRPLLINTVDRKWRGGKQFRYDNRWRLNPEVKQVISQAWVQRCSHLPPQSFNEALKRCRDSLSQWKANNLCNSKKRIHELQEALHKAYASYSIDYNHIAEIKSKLQTEYRLEEEYWYTKSRIQWLNAGDKNTQFFHAKTKQRRSYNRITSIQDATGYLHTNEKDIQGIITSYFSDIYSSSCRANLDQVLQHISPKVTPEINQKLTAPITEEEIHQALCQMNENKAPGPDGLTAGFFKQHWNTIKAANEVEAGHLLSLLHKYAEASGQQVNFQKSAILFGKNVPQDIQQNITRITGINRVGGFGKYLGLPELVGRNKCSIFSYITQRVQTKLDSWYSKLLSPAGKEVLIKSVATALPTYCIGWILQDGQAKHILKGSSSIAATESPLETEAIALKEAILRMKMLGYDHVTFCGDSAQIYRYLDNSCKSRSNLPRPPAAIQGHLEDIKALAYSTYMFKHIGRQDNTHADFLAKQARTNVSPYVISYIL